MTQRRNPERARKNWATRLSMIAIGVVVAAYLATIIALLAR
jgi:hypothetical protein